MTTASPEPTAQQRRSLDEEIDYAERLISEGSLLRAVSLLEELRQEAFTRFDLEALQRIADIASSSRYLSRRYQGRFDRLRLVADGNIGVITGQIAPVWQAGRPMRAERSGASAADASVSTAAVPLTRRAGEQIAVGESAVGERLAGDLLLAILAHVIALLVVVFVVVLLVVAVSPGEASDTEALAGGLWLMLYMPVLWFGSLAVIVWRWLKFAEGGVLLQTTAGFAAAALFPPTLLGLLSEEFRHFVGLVRWPR